MPSSTGSNQGVHDRLIVSFKTDSRGDLDRVSQRIRKTVLFLGTGNIYRSRFAEILFNSVAEKMGLAWQASSCGLGLEPGAKSVRSMTASAIKALEAMGIRAEDAVARSPVQVTNDDLESADRVVALNQDEHLPHLKERFPAWSENVEFWHIGDAPGALNLVEHSVMSLVARILGGGKRQESESSRAPITDCRPVKELPKKKITLKVGRETAHRRGKGVTTVFDTPLNEQSLRELAATLKQRCGTGGTVKDGRIEIQGDQRERIVAELDKLGYKVKRAGG
jgi:predicted translation initiation factor SUI1